MQKTNIPLIAGLASGFVLVNLVLALTWFLCRRSNMRKAQRRQQELAAERGMERSASFFKKNTAMSAPVDVEAPEEPDLDGQDELTHSEKPDRYTPPPKQANRRRQSQTAFMPPPGLAAPHSDRLTVPSSFKPLGTSGDSVCETESMYSTASAPIHLHEQILLSPPPNLIRNHNERLITPSRPARQHSFRGAEVVPLPSPIRPLLMASPISEAFGDELLSPGIDNAAPPHPRIAERTSQILLWSPSRRSSSSSNTRPTSEWYYTPKRTSVTLPPHLRPALVEPLRIAKSSPIGRQPAFKHPTTRPSPSA